MAIQTSDSPSRTWQYLVAALQLATASASSMAQDGDGSQAPSAALKTPLQIEAEEAQQRATIAESQFKEEKAKKDLAELNDLKSDFTPPPVGITTKDNAGYYGELLSFVTLEKSAMIFVESIPKQQIGRVIVSSDFNMTSVAALWHFTDNKFKAFEEDFPKLFATPFDDEQLKLASFIGPALAALGSAAELAAFFKVKQEISGRSITPSSEALKSLVVKHLKLRCDNGNCFKPVLPEFVVKIDPNLVKRIENLKEAEKAATKRRKAEINRVKNRYKIDLTKIDVQLAEVKKDLETQPDNAKLKKRKQQLETFKPWWGESAAAYEEVTSEFTSFMSRLEKVPEGANQSALEQLFLYSSVIIDDSTKILVAKAVSQGADMETSSGVFRRTKISFVGGSAAVFFLSDLDGNILLTDVIPTVASRSFTTRIESESAKRVPIELPK